VGLGGAFVDVMAQAPDLDKRPGLAGAHETERYEAGITHMAPRPICFRPLSCGGRG
jgi:hypothetical protein